MSTTITAAFESWPTARPAREGWRWAALRLPSGLLARAALPERPRHRPVLLVHGIAGGAWYWEAWLGFLADRGWPAYALELRGRPGSRPVPALGRVSLRDYVDDVREMAAALGRPAVVGHSMGGLLVQKAAESDPFAAIVLLCSMPPKGIWFARPRLMLRQLLHLRAMLLERPLVADPDDLAEMTLNRVPEPERAELARRFDPESGRVARELSLGGLAVDPAAIRAPLLAVGGREDRFFSPDVERKIAARYGIPLRLYENHAHFVVMEPGWERIAADVEAWLAEKL